MAIAFEGYDYVQASGNMSGTITIPANTDYAVCAIQGYDNASFTSVSIDGTAMSLIDSNSGTSVCFLYGLVSPTTGASVSVASVSGAWSEGVTYMFAFFSGVDQTTPTRDSTAQDADSGVSSAVLSCAAGDHAFISGFGNTPPTLTDNSQTLIVDSIAYRSQNGGCSRKAITSGTTTTVGTSGNNYGTMVAVILIEASSGALTLSGLSTSTSDATGVIDLLIDLIGLSSTASYGQGTLSVLALIELIGSSNSQSSGSAVFRQLIEASGHSTTESIGIGLLNKLLSIEGIGSTESKGAGTLAKLLEFAGQSDTLSTALGQISVSGLVQIAGVSATASGLSGQLNILLALNGIATSESIGQSSLNQLASLIGQSLTESQAHGIIEQVAELIARATTQSTGQGNLSAIDLDVQLSGISVTESIANGIVEVIGTLLFTETYDSLWSETEIYNGTFSESELYNSAWSRIERHNSFIGGI